MDALPGIEVLFRENRRLARKLTQGELKAIRRYIEDLLALENGEMAFQLTAMRTEYNNEMRKCSDTIETLEQEIKDKDTLLKHFSKSDDNLATVHRKRGERLEQMQSILVNDVEMAKIKCRNLFQKLTEVKEVLREKTCIIEEQNIRLNKFEKLNEHIDGANKLVNENQSLCRENLKLKLNLDKGDKLFTSLQERLLTIQKELNQLFKEKQECEQQGKELRKELTTLSKDMAVTCEQLSMAKYELQQKSKQVADITKEQQSLKNTLRLQNSSHLRNILPTQKATNDRKLKHLKVKKNRQINGLDAHATNDTYSLKNYEYLLFRTQILEENIEKYKGDCNNLDFLMDQSSTDEYILNEATSRLTINCNIAVEQLLRTLALRIRSRRSHFCNSLSGLLERLPSNVAVVATGLKTDVLDLEQKCEQLQMSGLCSHIKDLIPRIDACLNAKYTSSQRLLNDMSWVRPSRQRRSQSPDKQCPDGQNRRVNSRLTTSNKANGNQDTHVNRSSHLKKHRSSVPNKLCHPSPIPIDISLTSISQKTPQCTKTSFDLEFQPPGQNKLHSCLEI